MKKLVIPVSILLILVCVSLLPLGCTAKTNAATTPATQTATVQKGNLTIDITASGNLALAKTADLAFEMAGDVQEVLVEAGDNITAGQIVARLDTSAWEDQVTALQRQLTSVQRKLVTAQRAVTTAERALDTAKKQAVTSVATKELALLQKEIDLKNAQTALETAQDTYTGPNIEAAQAAVDRAKAYLQYALDSREQSAGASTAMWDSVISRAQSDLTSAEATLKQRMDGGDPDDIAIKKKQLEIAQQNYQTAKDAVPQAKEDGTIAVENATMSLEDAKTAADDAKTAVDDAQKALDDVKKASPLVKATFSGFVTAVNVKGGDELKKGAIACQIADPTRFEANILVSEMDINQVKVGSMATIQPTAMSTFSLPAAVTKIAPTATISQGVVNYQVTVEVQQLPAVIAQSPTGQQSTGQAPAGQAGTGQGGTRSTSGQTIRRPQAAGTTTEFQLRQGLTVTVSILVQQKRDVLLVPNQAITRSGQSVTVQVIKDGITAPREVKTGMSNWQSTEITEGLTEGETIIIPKDDRPDIIHFSKSGAGLYPRSRTLK